MRCEKCQDVGFIEFDKAGLLTQFCDCEIGKQIEAKKRAIYGIPEEVSDDSNDRAEPDNTDIGSPDTSEPKQSSKPKKKKKARKGAK